MIDEMLKTQPNDTFLRYAKALECIKADRKDEAVALLETLVSQQPEYLPSYYQLGQLYEALNRFSQAIKMHRTGKALAQKQTDPKTAGEHAEALFMLEGT